MNDDDFPPITVCYTEADRERARQQEIAERLSLDEIHEIAVGLAIASRAAGWKMAREIEARRLAESRKEQQ